MNAKVRKKRFWAAVLSIVAVLAMAVGGLGEPTVMSVYADTEINTGDLSENPQNNVININVGTIVQNNGKVGTNTVSDPNNTYPGIITHNNNLVDINRATIENNNADGTVTTNEGTIANNTGTIETNVGSITKNDSGGVITANTETGIVATNAGVITTNEGTIANNTGTITSNYGTIITGPGSVVKDYVRLSISGSGFGVSGTHDYKGLNWVEKDVYTPLTITPSSQDQEIEEVKLGDTIIGPSNDGKYFVKAANNNTLSVKLKSKIPAATITFDKTSPITILVDSSFNLTASINPSGTNVTSYEWRSLANDVASVIRSSSSQNVATITGHKAGQSAVIEVTATLQGGNQIKGEFTVNVSSAIVDYTYTTDGKVTPQRPGNIDSIATTRSNYYKTYFGGSNYLLHFPVNVKNDNSIAGKSKIETAVNAVKSKVDVYYVDVSPTEEVLLRGQTTKSKADIQDMGEVVSMPFTTPTTPYCVVLRYHNGELYPMARLTSTQSNPTLEGYYYNGKGQLNIYARYFSTFAIVLSNENIVTIGFNSNGGSHVDPVVITAGGTISEPTKPTRSGYTFEGWYMDEGLRTKWTTGTTFNSDWILNANWTQQNSGTTNSGNSGTSGSTSGSGGGTTNRGNNPSGTTPVNAPQTGDPIDYVRAFAAMIVICAGTLVLLYTLKARRRK